MSELEYPGFDFRILKRDENTDARRAEIVTPHGVIETPNFVFCATKGSVKSASPVDLRAAGAQIILSNTYHMMLRPGGELVEELGGLHKFIGWDGPMLTDSGGYQIFSLGHGSVSDEIKGRRDMAQKRTLLKITEQGAVFRSYVNGNKESLTPERAMEVQRQLGADLVLVLDECTPFNVERSYTARSLERSHRWAERSMAEFERSHNGRQALYGIVQGGVYPDLRKVAGEFISERPFFGHAIGGSLGGDKQQMYEVVRHAQAHLRRDRPVHLLGIGGVADIWEGVAAGVDTFDCVAPTRMARHGWALSRTDPRGRINLHNARYRTDERPLHDDCDCPTCQNHSRAFLHYLYKIGEPQAMHYVTVCNLRFMTRLVETVREAIDNGTFEEQRRAWTTPQ